MTAPKLTEAQREALAHMAQTFDATTRGDHDGSVTVRGYRSGAYRSLVDKGLAEKLGVDRASHEHTFRITENGLAALRGES
jgi:hypothetical protein